MNKFDLVKLQQNIDCLQALYDTWLQENEQPIDIGECGGGAITRIEELGETFLQMRDAFLLLLEHTISYMEGRKATSDATEKGLADGMRMEIK